MRKAILLLSYGSINLETLLKKYKPVLSQLGERYPDFDIHLTFASKKIHEKYGEAYGKPYEKVLQLKKQGYEEILLIPTLLFFGKTYLDGAEELRDFHLSFGPPLLSLEDNVDLFIKSYSKKEGKILLIAHKPASQTGLEQIRQINSYLKQKCPSIRIFFFSKIDKKEITAFLGADQKASLYPLFVYSNYHLKKDILSPTSRLNTLLCKRYDIDFIDKTLIDEPFFIDMILHSIRDVEDHKKTSKD